MKKANKTISIISAVLVLFLDSSAFLLSFDALQALAVEVGVEEKRAWLYPAIIDGAVIIFSLHVLRANLSQDKATYPWGLVGAFTLLSIALNIVHAQRNFLAQLLGRFPQLSCSCHLNC